jgi:hypothetical protein
MLEESSFQLLRHFHGSILHRRRSSRSFVPIQSSLSLLLSFTVKKALQLQHFSLRLPHVIRSGMITKHSHSVQFVILVRFSNQIFFHLWNLDLFLDSRQIFRLVLSSNAHNHCSVYRHKTHKNSLESRERCLHIWYSRVVILNLGAKIWNSQFGPNLSCSEF